MNDAIYPEHTPWGTPHSCRIAAEGIARYTTGSHGGYWLSPERVAAMPEGLRPTQNLGSDGGAWFEEDQEWAIVELAFPQHFETNDQEAARKLLMDWMPDLWEAWTGETLAPETSYTRRLAAFFAKHQNDQIVTGAYGSWDKRVPKGMVGLVALTGGRPQKGQLHGPESHWLVDEKEYGDAYKRPGYLGYFVIDPTRHQLWSREVLAEPA